MSATNKTTNYDLPLFIGTDIPSWLGDWNNTMTTLDKSITDVNTTAESAIATANTAESKGDKNTTSIQQLSAQIKALQDVTSNYAEILTFKSIPLVFDVNNTDVQARPDRNKGIIIQNSNKTINKLQMAVNFLSTNKVNYKWNNGWFYPAATVEDNVFNLTASIAPSNDTCLNLGMYITISSTSSGSQPNGFNFFAWFNGATTYIGAWLNEDIQLPGRFVVLNTPIFLTGNVFGWNPDTPIES